MSSRHFVHCKYTHFLLVNYTSLKLREKKRSETRRWCPRVLPSKHSMTSSRKLHLATVQALDNSFPHIYTGLVSPSKMITYLAPDLDKALGWLPWICHLKMLVSLLEAKGLLPFAKRSWGVCRKSIWTTLYYDGWKAITYPEMGLCLSSF